MDYNQLGKNTTEVKTDGIVLHDVPSALDFMMSVQYQQDASNVIIKKENLTEEFFDLRSGLAGKILQKFVQYDVKLAIVGDFSVYSSQALQDFIYECNEGHHIFFVSDVEEAMQKFNRS
jgi:hypothetical protein